MYLCAKYVGSGSDKMMPIRPDLAPDPQHRHASSFPKYTRYVFILTLVMQNYINCTVVLCLKKIRSGYGSNLQEKVSNQTIATMLVEGYSEYSTKKVCIHALLYMQQAITERIAVIFPNLCLSLCFSNCIQYVIINHRRQLLFWAVNSVTIIYICRINTVKCFGP
jgi:hypothetical protein